MRLVFMGTPEFAIPSLERLALAHTILAVYTRPDKPSGRGLSPAISPVEKIALERSLTVAQPASLKNPDVVAGIKALAPEAIVAAAYGQIIPKDILDIPPHGCLNIHPSLLPRYRGAAPIPAAILAGDDFTGVSIMLMDEGLDTGPVLTRAQVSIADNDTTGTLTGKLALVSAHLVDDVLARWARREMAPRPQDNAGAVFTRPITRDAGEMDWSLPAVRLWRQVRAYNPWPAGYTRLAGKLLKILAAFPIPERRAEPGRIIALEGGAAFAVGTGDGLLGVSWVQLEGKRAMSAAEFLRGQRSLIGLTLPG